MAPINFPNRPPLGLWEWYDERETYDAAIEDRLRDHETRIGTSEEEVTELKKTFVTAVVDEHGTTFYQNGEAL